MKTYRTYYRRHRQTFLGWNTRFIVEGERWAWKLRPSCKSETEVRFAILSRFPTATDIEMVKIMSEE